MARVPYVPPAKEAPAQISFLEAVAPAAPVAAQAPRKRLTSAKTALRKALAEIDAMVTAGGWKDAASAHLVALYARLHEKVYGTPPAELAEQEAWHGAVSAAGKLVRDEFGGRPEAAVEFLRWVWQRERSNEQRRTDGADGRRIGWRLQFVRRHLLTDYRTAQARARNRGDRS